MKKNKSPWAGMKIESKAEEKSEHKGSAKESKNIAELELQMKSKAKPEKPQMKSQSVPGKRKLGAAGTSSTYNKDQVRHTLNQLLGKE